MEDWEVEAMTEKKSFVAYYSWWEVISKLDDHQKALVLEAMFSTGGVCDKPELDLLSEVVFIPIEREIQANAEKWAETREKRREAGRKGGKASRKNAKNEEANEASAYFAKQDQAKVSNAKQSQANQAVDVDVDADVDVDVDEDADEDVVININATDVASNEVSSSSSKQEKSSKRTARQHFEELWALYPNKRGKSEINDDMKESLMNISVEDMKEAVNRYVYEVRTSTYDRNWMNGSTWFNGRFLDYVGDSYQPPQSIVKARKGQYISREGFREFGAIEE